MPKQPTENPKIPSENLFPVVGIGASAGGLGAFKQFIKAIAVDSGMAYILVQHLHPGHESVLPEILQKETKIPVVEITDKVQVEPNRIYIIPSNKLLVANDGMLKLSPRPAKDELNKPIDLFFSSLAEVHQGHAIGVVLSGTGTDGTAGLKDIKDQGGLTFAQDPASADYDGMPQSAIDAEIVDFVLTPENIPHRLMELKESFKIFSSEEDIAACEPTEEDGFRKILALLRIRKGIDFTLYKQTTIRRRIIRRMVMLKLEKMAEYVAYLKKNKPEQDLLFDDMILLALDDITVGKEAEKILKDKADVVLKDYQVRHDFFMQTPAMLCILTGPEHIFEFANEPYRQLIGNRNPVGKTLKEALPELEGQGFPEILDKVYQTGEPYIGKEMPASLLRDGKMEQVFVDFYYQAFKDDEGKTEGILVFCYDVTEQVLNRQRIEEGERRYRELVSGLPVAVYTCDAEGYLTLYNEAGVKLWGRRPEIGKDLWCGSWKIFTTKGEPLPLEECPMAIVLKEGRIVHTEIVIQRPDGVKRHIIPYPQPEYDSNGKITGAVNTLIDITEQVEARQKIEASQKRYEMMVMQSPFGFAVQKGKGMVITLANDSIKEMWGKGKEIEGKPLLQVLPEIEDTHFPGLLHEVYTTGIPYYAYESRVQLMRNGKMEDVYFNFIYQPYREADETISGVAVIAIEVTPQAELNKKLKESENRFRDMANNVPALIWVSDRYGKRNFFNKSWQGATGRVLEQDEDMGWVETVYPEDKKRFLKIYKDGMQNQMPFEIEYRLRQWDGKYRWTLCRAIPSYNNEGAFSGFLGVCYDIQEQKMLEQTKDDFISISSHEMKTPLSTAKAYLQLLEESLKATNPESWLFAKKAGKSVERLNGLISELLDVSKINYGKLNYNFSTFSFNEMLDSAIEEVQYASKKHAIIKTSEVVVAVTGDKERLQQVVINLLSNAVKYSPKAEKVFINVEQGTNGIKVSVKDKGIGLSKNNLKKIFEKYHRVEDPSLQTQGLGIGLFISYEIIQRHHGKLWVESEIGEGSTFYFTLPIEL